MRLFQLALSALLVAAFLAAPSLHRPAREKIRKAEPFTGVWTLADSPSLPDPRPYRAFPSLYFRASRAKLPDTVPESGTAGVPAPEILDRQPILANSTVLALYGNPLSKKMGILGMHSKEELADLLEEFGRGYDAANGARSVIPAFYIVYGTCWPGGEIGYVSDALMLEYIQFAAERGILVFIDHQIGKYRVDQAMERILPFLAYPNVHLALDPEWRTTKPMREIGSMTAAELNEAQRAMQYYMEENRIPGLRMLVVHQFKDSMISSSDTVSATFDRILLVHTADGFGNPALKRHRYALNAKSANMPLKGFKLFLKSGFPGAGFDEPLLSPSEVMALDPEPALVMYQ